MKRLRERPFAPASFLACVLALAISCGPVTEVENPGLAGPCTETGNPTGLAGKVLSQAGGPAGEVPVKAYKRITDTLGGTVEYLAKVSSCPDGTFEFGPLPQAQYALEARDSLGGTLAWLPSLASNGANPVTLTLQPPGSIRGRVSRGGAVPGIAGQEKILVRLAFAPHALLTDSGGTFEFAGVAEGTYRLVFAATDGHFLTHYVDSVEVKPGEVTELPPVRLEASPFAAPPAPTGLDLDNSGTGIIRLSWNSIFLANFSHYEVLKTDMGGGRPETWQVREPLLLDTLSPSGSGMGFRYEVRTVNLLGNAGPWAALADAQVPVEPSDSGNAALDITVLDGLGPAYAAKARLYRVPALENPPGRLPLQVRLLDSSITGAGGQVRFAGLAQGEYGVETWDARGKKSAYGRLITSAAGGKADTLRLQEPGFLQGKASRGRIWVSAPGKGSENIQVTLEGSPYIAYSESNGSFGMGPIPPGRYRAIVHALPEGFFLADTLSIDIKAGDTLDLPAIDSRYNPLAPPPKPVELRLAQAVDKEIHLQWKPVSSAYPFLQGYQVIRWSEAPETFRQSEIISGTAYVDELPDLPSGTILNYVVRAVNMRGEHGLHGGDAGGLPVTYRVP